MPTPAMHLACAQEMLRGEELSLDARRLLHQQQGPFLLGNTAPDVRTVSGQSREACHFYTVPRTSDKPAHRALFDAYPSLTRVQALSPPRIAFIAGYIAHLLLDELWLDDIFQDFVIQDGGSLGERLFLHNVLRTWMDLRAQEALGGAVVHALREAEPTGWLPFVEDEHLRMWRDWLAAQLGPDRRMETAEVLASRMGIPAEDIETVAQSPLQMEERVFRRFPRSVLQAFRRRGHQLSLALVDWYVRGSARGQIDPILIDLSVANLPTHQS